MPMSRRAANVIGSLLLLSVPLLLGGCGEFENAAFEQYGYDSTKSASDKSMETAASSAIALVDNSRSLASGDRLGEVIERKIIYNVELNLVVEDFGNLREKVESLVKKSSGAYISNASNRGRSGRSRQGTWVIRVPQKNYEDLVQEFRALGDVTRETRDSEDITDQFYDLRSRLKTKQNTETRLLQFLDEKTGKLEDVIKIETELDRIRSQIEVMQGRLNRLAALSSLTTVTLHVNEIKNYQPATEIGFGTRISNSLNQSVEALVGAGKRTVLLLVALAPWVPLILLAFFVIRFLCRRLLKRVAPKH